MYKIKYDFSSSVHFTENIHLYADDENVGVRKTNDDENDDDDEDDNYNCKYYYYLFIFTIFFAFDIG
jgi:hypothetical protein